MKIFSKLKNNRLTVIFLVLFITFIFSLFLLSFDSDDLDILVFLIWLVIPFISLLALAIKIMWKLSLTFKVAGKKKQVLVVIAFLLITVGGLIRLISLNKFPKDGKPLPEPIAEQHEMMGDFDGDGELEYLEVSSDEGALRPTALITVKELDGDIIGNIPEGLPINRPMDNSFQTYRLAGDIEKDFFSFDFIAGPHQFERMFFELYKDMVLPICFTKNVTGPYDCLFYTSRADGFIVKDFDSDGFVEIVETRDEYPSGGELSKEELEAVEQGFGEQGVSESAKDAAEIASREKGGRGRPVAWAIYSYDGEIFNQQEGDGFDRLFSLLTKEYPDMITKADLSQESLEYSEFVRNFWSRRE